MWEINDFPDSLRNRILYFLNSKIIAFSVTKLLDKKTMDTEIEEENEVSFGFKLL